MLAEYPLRIIIENPKTNGRITKWVMEIRPLGVTFEPWTMIKRQILADFIVEFKPESPPQSNLLKGWILNVDETSNGKCTRVGIVLTVLEGSIIEQFYSLGF